MAMSKGQHIGHGHSDGPYGHGGHHTGSHVTTGGKPSPHTEHMTYKGPGTENVHNSPKAPAGTFPQAIG